MGNELLKYAIVPPNKLPKLYHLSFRDDLEGMWTPKSPAGDYDETTDKDLLPETTGKRISASPSIEQCFQAIYANIKHLYTKKHKELTLKVYSPVFKGKELVVYPEVLTKHKLVHDAHITKEHCIISPVFMRLIGEVIIEKPDPKNNIDYYAYNIKTKGEPYGWVPGKIKIKEIPYKNWLIL